jgi:tRNA-dihydrouridine synthase B
MIYLAPLQGFTDYIYRKVYAGIFSGVDAFFIPYITVQHEQLSRKYGREILPSNNLYGRCIPQVLIRDEYELQFLVSVLKSHGYAEVNLNMGCPYPMVTNRGRGAALLKNPDKLRTILDTFFAAFNLKLSVKLRAGLKSPDELGAVIEVLNDFPLSEIILHPRSATQLYKGIINDEAFQQAVHESEHPVIYNGDIFSLADFEQRSAKFTTVDDWMLGRGVLMNVFLPEEVRGKFYAENEKRLLLSKFHSGIVEAYLQAADNEGNALNKLKQFWIYFSHHFRDQVRLLKKIKKAKTMLEFNTATTVAIRESALQQNA